MSKLDNSRSYIGIHADNMGFDAHLTLIFLGEIDKKSNNYIMKVMKEWGSFNSRVVRKDFEVFANSTPVVTVIPYTHTYEYIKFLNRKGIESNSNYPWSPHIPLKMPISDMDSLIIPPVISISRPYLKWNGVKYYA